MNNMSFPDVKQMSLNMSIQELDIYYSDPLNPYDASINNSNLILNNNLLTQLVITPYDSMNSDRENNGCYKGFIDGFMNDCLLNFSVKKNSSEKWFYFNMDAQDTHPFHFHLTSGYTNLCPNNNSKYNDYFEENPFKPNLFRTDNFYTGLLYSKDTISIPSQNWLGFNLCFNNYTSLDTSISNHKFIKLGYMYHCHYLVHHDMGMMGQYYVN
jgi:FtsP/CotA-like multicopper oxidase with cupredoxin domain